MLLPSVLLLLVGVSSVAATTGNIIPNCTDASDKYLETAIICDDVLGKSYCETAYPSDSTFIAPVLGQAKTAQETRIPQCYSSITDPKTPPATVTTDQDFITAAVMTCPKRCGFCCMSPKYNCKDADEPAVKCETVTQAMCKDPKWRDTIAVNCPSKCGFCLDGGCVDSAVDCDKDPKLCTKPVMATFAKANCKRTCGFCATNTTTGGTPGTVTCGDSHPNCANWVHNGFCQSNGYTADQKRQYCGRSCGFC